MSSKGLFAFVWLFVLFLVQNALVYVFPEKAPALVLIGVLYFALAEGRLFGVVCGVWGGLLIDLFCPERPGFTSAAFACAGFCCGFISSKIFQDSLLTEITLPPLCLYAVTLAGLIVSQTSAGEVFGMRAFADAFLPWPLAATAFSSPWLFARLRGVSPRRRRRWAPLY